MFCLEQWDQWHCHQCIRHPEENKNVNLFIIDAPATWCNGAVHIAVWYRSSLVRGLKRAQKYEYIWKYVISTQTFVYTYAFLIAATHVHHSKQTHICMYLEDSSIFQPWITADNSTHSNDLRHSLKELDNYGFQEVVFLHRFISRGTDLWCTKYVCVNTSF